ncbi:ABC transporter ATP-binding protein [uncultured Ilyobacter sp.]|uniref:ABC transporter ATP-binding protein n=1 Tax=uncultured Ilyobacter sp. TaxID=544433 RepID=UPI0029C9966C|nr:ABC transporter ATP-binding protein [uncultured Ilyobacter sp.]
MDKLLEVKNLSVKLGEKEVIKNLCLDIYKGEVVALVGESGSGKSTLARTIMGFQDVYRGEILFKNRRIDTLSDKEYSKIRGKEISIVFQNSMNAFNPTIRTGFQIEEPLYIHTSEKKKSILDKVYTALGKLNLDKRRTYSSFPHELSGGMKQRAAFAMGSICDPEILILDEVTTAIDIVNFRMIINSVKQKKSKTGVLLITHNMNLARNLADRMAIIKNGVIIEEGKDVLNDPLHPYTKLLVSSELTTSCKKKKIKIPVYKKTNIESAGCPFAPNCFEAMKICTEEVGYEKKIDNRIIRCWQYHPECLRRKEYE